MLTAITFHLGFSSICFHIQFCMCVSQSSQSSQFVFGSLFVFACLCLSERLSTHVIHIICKTFCKTLSLSYQCHSNWVSFVFESKLIENFIAHAFEIEYFVLFLFRSCQNMVASMWIHFNLCNINVKCKLQMALIQIHLDIVPRVIPSTWTWWMVNTFDAFLCSSARLSVTQNCAHVQTFRRLQSIIRVKQQHFVWFSFIRGNEKQSISHVWIVSANVDNSIFDCVQDWPTFWRYLMFVHLNW